MLKDAGLDGHVTNHSLGCTCAITLFQRGESVKIVKEITSHVADAVHKWQVNFLEAVPMKIVAPKQRSNVEVFKMDRLVLPKIDKEENKFEESSVSETSQNVVSIIELAISTWCM